MNARALVAVLVAVIAAGAVLLLWPKEQHTPEDEVRALIAKCIAGVERNDIGPLVEAMATNFKGPSGLGRDEVRGVLLGQVMRQQGPITILNPTLDVKETAPGLITFTGQFVMTRPQDGVSRHEISGTVQKLDADWQFVEVGWRRL